MSLDSFLGVHTLTRLVAASLSDEPRTPKSEHDNIASMKEEGEDEEAMEVENEDEAAMMAMMGFGGFDTTKVYMPITLSLDKLFTIILRINLWLVIKRGLSMSRNRGRGDNI